VLGEMIKEFNDKNITVVFSGAKESFKSSVTKLLDKINVESDIFFPGIPAVFMKFQYFK
jgi:hypothetical protein